MSTTHVLIVDDDKSVLRMIEYGLNKLGPEFKISTATDMDGALAQIEQQQFDLIITDYMMPGLTGVDLARAVNRLSPNTQIVLMTAYGTEKLRDTSAHIGFDRYIDKPFDIEIIRDIIRDAKSANADGDKASAEPEVSESPAIANDVAPASDASIMGTLRALQVNAGARAVLLLNAEDDPVKFVGQIDQTKATNIAALVASSFLQTAELAALLDNNRVFKSGFYEGDSYNIYVCDVNENSLLAVIFDVKLRPGVVWFYTKQTATDLAPLLVTPTADPE
jgi:CheY-like chemotaxis protein